MHISSPSLLILHLHLSIASAIQITPIHTFPPRIFIENIAIRSNSKILLTSMSTLTLSTINPLVSPATVETVHTFPSELATGLIGITESTPDIFAVTTGIIDLANTRVTPGSLIVWTVDLRRIHRPPIIKRVTTVQNTTIINGITTLPTAPHILLAADSAAGTVWRINLQTGNSTIIFSDPLFKPVNATPGSNLGINGLQAAGQFLYFTNSAQGLFGRVPISRGGEKTGDVQVLARPMREGLVYDDIAVDGEGNAWIATHPVDVVRIRGLEGKGGIKQETWGDSEVLLNPTA
ncbi:hypothetical protein HYALB_00013890, partial [Hymenoscyphus albidus]